MIGMGHINRCKALAEKLKRSYPDVSIIWYVNESMHGAEREVQLPSNSFDMDEIEAIQRANPDLIIVDSYSVSFDYLVRLHNIGTSIMFDDYMMFPEMPADYVINGNIHADSLNYRGYFPSTKFLIGEKYLFLSKEYSLPPDDKPAPGTVLVTTGSSDNEGFMERLTEWLGGVIGYTFVFIIGKYFNNPESYIKKILLWPNCQFVQSPSSLRSHIVKAETVLTTSGLTIYEVMACRRRLICFQTVENQILAGKEVARKGKGINLGWYSTINADDIKGALIKINA